MYSSTKCLESRIKKGFEIAVKNKLKIIMPKKTSIESPIIHYVNKKWDGDNVKMNDVDWNNILNNNIS